MVPSDPRRLRTAVSVTQPYSGRRPEPPVAGCRLGIMARSRQRTPIPRAASFGRQKHGLRFRSRWTSAIFGPRRCTNCARSGSTRPREPWATGTYESMASCRSSQPLKPTPSSNPLHEITRFQSPNSRIAVLQQPLARVPCRLVRSENHRLLCNSRYASLFETPISLAILLSAVFSSSFSSAMI